MERAECWGGERILPRKGPVTLKSSCSLAQSVAHATASPCGHLCPHGSCWLVGSRAWLPPHAPRPSAARPASPQTLRPGPPAVQRSRRYIQDTLCTCGRGRRAESLAPGPGVGPAALGWHSSNCAQSGGRIPAAARWPRTRGQAQSAFRASPSGSGGSWHRGPCPEHGSRWVTAVMEGGGAQGAVGTCFSFSPNAPGTGFITTVRA